VDLTISGRHVDVTDAMRAHARERVSRLQKYSPNLMRARVTLSIQGERHIAEIVATVRGRSELVAKCESHDMYLSIDRAAEKVEKQIHRLEERARERRQGGHPKRPQGGGGSETSPA